MATRRMFSLKVIDTDQFIDMPATTQLLYFHLSLRADDDGFVSSPKKIQKMVNCGEDDMKLLIAKQYIIPFENGVCVVKHWKIHNYIQKDRYNETIYKDEKAKLLDTSLGYTMDTKCIHDVSIPDTQVRLGKVKLELNKTPPKIYNISQTVPYMEEIERPVVEVDPYKIFYEDNYCQPITPIFYTRLMDYEAKGLHPELIKTAMEKGIGTKIPTEYIKGILDRCLKANIMNMDDYSKEQAKYEKLKQKPKINAKIPQLTNFDQRQYEDEDFDIFYKHT